MSTYHRNREAFGARLRDLRDSHVPAVSGRALAGLLGWPQSKISRLETGRQTPTIAEVTAWMDALGVSGEARDDVLTELHNLLSGYATWRRRAAAGNRVKQDEYRDLESSFHTLRAFETAIVPGLLQTPDYARHRLATFAELTGTPADIDDGVRARMRRQELLYEPGRDLRFLIAETALRARLAPTPVLRGQLDRLLTLAAGLDTTKLAILPARVALTTPIYHGFWVYDADMVLIETYAAELAVRDTGDVELYVRLFDDLWNRAASDDAARSLIMSAAADLQE